MRKLLALSTVLIPLLALASIITVDVNDDEYTCTSSYFEYDGTNTVMSASGCTLTSELPPEEPPPEEPPPPPPTTSDPGGVWYYSGGGAFDPTPNSNRTYVPGCIGLPKTTTSCMWNGYMQFGTTYSVRMPDTGQLSGTILVARAETGETCNGIDAGMSVTAGDLNTCAAKGSAFPTIYWVKQSEYDRYIASSAAQYFDYYANYCKIPDNEQVYFNFTLARTASCRVQVNIY